MNKHAPYYELDANQRKRINRVLSALGPERVLRALTKTCGKKYINSGWSNCFLVQALGGKVLFDKAMKDIEKAPNYYPHDDYVEKIARVLKVDKEDVSEVINAFDEEDRATFDFFRLVDQYLNREKVSADHIPDWETTARNRITG